LFLQLCFVLSSVRTTFFMLCHRAIVEGLLLLINNLM